MILSRTYPGAHFTFEVTGKDGEGIQIDSVPLLQRIACHFLLERLPDESLEEIWEHLVDAAEFWIDRPSSAIPTLPLGSVQRGVLSPTEREAFFVTEE